MELENFFLIRNELRPWILIRKKKKNVAGVIESETIGDHKCDLKIRFF